MALLADAVPMAGWGSGHGLLTGQGKGRGLVESDVDGRTGSGLRLEL